MRAMFDQVDRVLGERGCDETRAVTEEWLRARGEVSGAVLAWLDRNSGYCDCEVLSNSEPAWLDALGGVLDRVLALSGPCPELVQAVAVLRQSGDALPTEGEGAWDLDIADVAAGIVGLESRAHAFSRRLSQQTGGAEFTLLASDGHGNVACFWSLEPEKMPPGVADDLSLHDIALLALGVLPRTQEHWRIEQGGDCLEGRMVRKGLYVYEYSVFDRRGYDRIAVPERPRKVSDFPPGLAAFLAERCLDGCDFSAEEFVVLASAGPVSSPRQGGIHSIEGERGSIE